jgi:uncharacterized protein YbjT (DUF2867 family)
MKVILFGATGMVGEGVLHEALQDDGVEAVLVVGRRACGVTHPKVREVLHKNFFDFTTIREQLRGYDACLFCLGVTSIGKNEMDYSRLTYDLTMAAARVLAKENPAMVFCYISGAGTDSTEHGKSMWARVKGKTENDLMRLPFKAVYAIRPGFIRPTPGLRNTMFFAKVLSPLYPVLHVFMAKYICTMQDLGRAMLRVSREGYAKKVVECVDIEELARR